MRKIPIAFPYYTQDEADMVSRCLKSGWVAQGPMVAEFEKKTASYEGVKHGIAVTSCTTALHLLISALNIHEGQDVLVPSFTFVATANAVEYTGAVAVLVDVETDTYCIDVEKLKIFIEQNYHESCGKMINKKNENELTAIIAVHLFGICANMPEVNEIAKKYNIMVIEDAACALGASINGTHEGDFGNPSCLSFHARKSISTGEGGMILTNDDALADKLRRLRSHGATVSEVARHNGSTGFLLPEYNELGFNYRMTDIQGAVGVSQVDKLNFIIEKRREQAARYDKIFKERFPFIRPPVVPDGYYHTYQSYVTILDYQKLGLKNIEEGYAYRNRLMEKLENAGVSTRQGTHAVHLLGYYAKKYKYNPYDLSGACACDRLTLAFPLYVGLTEDDQEYVAGEVYNAAN